MLERLFRLRERGTTVRAEVLGGATTFVTMAYIVVVNPAILSFAGLPVGPSTVATILSAVFGSLLMGLWANRPIAVAPYMGENAFIAFGLAALGITWQQRLGAVFVSGFKTRVDKDVRFDLHADYSLKFGDQRLVLLADVFNLFDRQVPTSYDQTTEISFQAPNPDYGTAKNPAGTLAQFSTPRQVRVGARFEW